MKAHIQNFSWQPKLSWREHWQYAIIILLILLFAFTALYNLGQAPLENWDEAFYGENIKQIVQTNDWLVLKFNGYPFTEKPPLYMWISATLGTIFGVSEFIVRFPSAVSGVIIVALVMWYVYRRFGLIPALAAFATLGLNDIFVWRTRNGDLDTLSALFFLCIFILMVSAKRWRYPVIGVLLALLYMTKLALVAVPLLIFGVHEVLFMHKEWREKPSYYMGEYGRLLACAIIGPAMWIFLSYQRLGTEVITAYLVRSDAGAFEPSFRHFSWNYLQYAYYSLQRRLFPLLVWGLTCVAFSIRKRWHLTLFLFSTILFVQLLFFERKNNWYLVPLFPFWSIAIGYGVKKALDLFKTYQYRWILSSIFVLGLLIISIRTYIINIIPTFNTFGTTREAQTAITVRKLSQPGDIVVRLDHQYPTAIYYSNRRILSSPSDYKGGGGLQGKDHFISQENVAKSIRGSRIHWVIGKKADINNFLDAYHLTPKRRIDTNDEEIVVEF